MSGAEWRVKTQVTGIGAGAGKGSGRGSSREKGEKDVVFGFVRMHR